MSWSTVSSSKRGYGYAWQKKRKLALARDHGLCLPCKRAGRVTLATQVDHVLSKAYGKRHGIAVAQIEALGNLQSICAKCHDEKSAKEEGKELIPRVAVGADGWAA